MNRFIDALDELVDTLREVREQVLDICYYLHQVNREVRRIRRRRAKRARSNPRPSFFLSAHGVEPQSEAYRAMSGHVGEGAPHRPLNAPLPLGAEGGEGAEPKWRHVDVEPNWKAAEEWKEPEEEEEVKGKVRVKALYCDNCKSLTNHGFLGYHYAAAEYCCFSCGLITLEYLEGKMRGVVISEERFAEFMERFGEIAEAAAKALELLKKLDVEFAKVWEIMKYVIEAKVVAESWRDIMVSEARYYKIRE